MPTRGISSAIAQGRYALFEYVSLTLVSLWIQKNHGRMLPPQYSHPMLSTRRCLPFPTQSLCLGFLSVGGHSVSVTEKGAVTGSPCELSLHGRSDLMLQERKRHQQGKGGISCSPRIGTSDNLTNEPPRGRVYLASQTKFQR